MEMNTNIITYKDKEYRLEFDLNVIELIQNEFGSLDNWGKLTGGSSQEPNAKAIIFGYWAMMNEAIEIDNEERGTDIKPLTLKQVGRMVTDIGIGEVLQSLNKTVVESTKSDEKNE